LSLTQKPLAKQIHFAGQFNAQLLMANADMSCDTAHHQGTVSTPFVSGCASRERLHFGDLCEHTITFESPLVKE